MEKFSVRYIILELVIVTTYDTKFRKVYCFVKLHIFTTIRKAFYQVDYVNDFLTPKLVNKVMQRDDKRNNN